MTDKLPIKNEPSTLKTEEQVRHLGNTVPTSDMSRLIAEAVAEALKVAIPAGIVGIEQARSGADNKAREAVVREMMRRTKRCPICGQPETACGGAFKKDKDGNDIVEHNEDGSLKYNYQLNHTQEYVGPKDENLFKWFQGIRVNGVRYLSDHWGHRVWIPRKSDILTSISAWEQNEKELSQKRSAEGMGMGSVGPGGVVKQGQGAIGWR